MALQDQLPAFPFHPPYTVTVLPVHLFSESQSELSVYEPFLAGSSYIFFASL